MSTEPITSSIISKYIILAMIAVFGAVTHTLVEQRAGRVKNFIDGLYLTIISGFASTMWLLIALNYFPHNILVIGFVTGMGGFMSLEGLAFIINYLKRKFLTVEK